MKTNFLGFSAICLGASLIAATYIAKLQDRLLAQSKAGAELRADLRSLERMHVEAEAANLKDWRDLQERMEEIRSFQEEVARAHSNLVAQVNWLDAGVRMLMTNTLQTGTNLEVLRAGLLGTITNCVRLNDRVSSLSEAVQHTDDRLTKVIKADVEFDRQQMRLLSR